MNCKKLISTGAASALVILVTVTGLRGQSGKASSSDSQKAVLARLAQIQEAAQALDADKVFSFVLENDAGAVAQNGRLLLTRKEALESTKQGFQRLQRVEYRFDQQHVTMLSPTVALAVGEGSTSATTESGRAIDARFVQSVVLVLTNGEWKVFHSHRSAPAPR
jgi:uncharacterized protein (TIGR02246 family)